MAQSLGLTAYRALMRRGEAEMPRHVVARPQGELIWIHAAEPGNTGPLVDLSMRLMSFRDGLGVLLTVPAGHTKPDLYRQPSILTGEIPQDHSRSVQAFLDHWQPDACLWAWGGLRPNLVLATAERDVPMVLIDADSAGFDGRRDRWLPNLARRLLTEFATILVRSPAGARRLTQLGLTRDDFSVVTPLMVGGRALPCQDQDVVAFSAAIVGRSAWFANAIGWGEVQTVLKAHKQALRMSHRLLLVLRPVDGLTTADVLELARALDLTSQGWDDRTHPDEVTQLLVVTEAQDVGLFYRVAAVSFMGGSLVSGGATCDPFEAAALGSAILYGPKVGKFVHSYSRLAAAGAARIVNDANALATAVTRLAAPDQAAMMAHAGWDVISEGASVTDRVVDLAQDALDRRWSKT